MKSIIYNSITTNFLLILYHINLLSLTLFLFLFWVLFFPFPFPFPFTYSPFLIFSYILFLFFSSSHSFSFSFSFFFFPFPFFLPIVVQDVYTSVLDIVRMKINIDVKIPADCVNDAGKILECYLLFILSLPMAHHHSFINYHIFILILIILIFAVDIKP